MEYLSNGEDIPEDVRDMSKIISDPELLMKEALKLSDPAWADNLNYVNIFFHGGRKQFHATIMMTWVRDFVTAVETEFKIHEGLFSEGERRFIGWRPLQSDPREDDIISTIPIVLENAKRTNSIYKSSENKGTLSGERDATSVKGNVTVAGKTTSSLS